MGATHRAIFAASVPYATLTKTNDRAAVLREVSQRIKTLADPQEQSKLKAASAVLAALSLAKELLAKELIKQILRRDMMQQSPLYLAQKNRAASEDTTRFTNSQTTLN